MAEIITFLSNAVVSNILVAYILVLWIALTGWAVMDIFSRTNNWLLRIGASLLVGLGFFFGFVLYLIIRPGVTTEDVKLRELEEKMLENQSKTSACPRCNELVREDFLFCVNCGLPVKKECPSCSSRLEVSWSQCPFCGINVGTPVLPEIKETLGEVNVGSGSLLGKFTKLFNSPVTPKEIKRGRGRPRKIVTGPVVLKRGRGRPRKNANI